jgi:hypothetical protein
MWVFFVWFGGMRGGRMGYVGIDGVGCYHVSYVNREEMELLSFSSD